MTDERTDSVLDGYVPGEFYCEMLRNPEAAKVRERLAKLSITELRRRATDAESELYNLGITFTVYSDNLAIDRILPFDVIPRVIAAKEWARIEAGVIQRVAAINELLHDLYHDQKLLKDGIIPAELLLGNANYRPLMQGVDLPYRSYVNICGTDLVRNAEGGFMVLEDNARTPSGVSYVIENRHLMQRAFPDLLTDIGIRPVDNYGFKLVQAMREIAPKGIDEPQVVLLSPGTYNSAYFEHVFLAREMGIPLVEGHDLVIRDDRVYMRTIDGLTRIDVIYRRLNDEFLDPEAFRPDSMLGVRGLMRAYKAGNVALANAIGTGVADDKAVYAYMPRIIKYYLAEEPILPNVETHICREPDALKYTLDHLSELVVKPVGEAGGKARLLARLDEELWETKFDKDKSEIGLLYGLIGKVRAMLLLKEMLREGWIKDTRDYNSFKAQLAGVPADRLPAEKKFNPLALNPYVLFKALPQVKKYYSAELVRAMDILLKCNQRLVTSGLDEVLVLQQALVQIVSSGGLSA